METTSTDGHITKNNLDTFIIREHGRSATLLKYEDYTESAQLIEWCYGPDNYHFFFTTNSGHHPLNLMGPAITKVIPWNLEHANDPEKYVENNILKSGYLLDLRILQMNRLIPLPRKASGDAHEFSDDTPVNTEMLWDKIQSKERNNFDPKISIPPMDKLYQLRAPVEENLYIVSYAHPLRARDDDKFYPYQIHYLSKEQLDVIDQKPDQHYNLQDNFADTNPDGTCSDDTCRDKRIASMSLARYYRDTGVQVGAINPKDIPKIKDMIIDAYQQENADQPTMQRLFKLEGPGGGGHGTTCMIANLKSFL